MVCWVAERARLARNVSRVIVATDSQQIVDAVESRGFESVLTAAHHTSGTDRVAEVAAQIPDAEIIVNVQGDEPLISPETIERAVDVMSAEISKPDGAGIVTTWEPIDSLDELLNPDLVKVVLDEHELAIYFSRSPMPYPRRGKEPWLSRSGIDEPAGSAQTISQAHWSVCLSPRCAAPVYEVAAVSSRKDRSTRTTACVRTRNKDQSG